MIGQVENITFGGKSLRSSLAFSNFMREINTNMKLLISACTFVLIFNVPEVFGQNYRWQQKADYRMNIDFDVENDRFKGDQLLFYFNQSPDTLYRVFYHLYFNAFQPGSMMDIRSRSLPDPDQRVRDRIGQLKDDEIGFIKVEELKHNGEVLDPVTQGTVLEVELANPIPPNSSTVFEMKFSGQVPLQIRRSGRDNKEGISYSMAQWYPKMCEYDEQGWHANPYVGREFYGVWSNFDVKISIDPRYTVGATGVLQNADVIGHGYVDEQIKHKRNKSITWHFKAENVHDFVWAADPDYTHTRVLTDDGTELHFFYQETKNNKDAWEVLPRAMTEAWSRIEKRFGEYPYPCYSFIQGGDGGMEYPMATLITGERSVGSLVGVSVHELMHSWFQMALGTNESLYAWMDEGFTSFASTIIMNGLRQANIIPGKYQDKPFVNTYNGYRNLIKSGKEEPLSTHADHFKTNFAYGAGSYTKGSVFLKQLEYIVGVETFSRAILRYYNEWKFRHPNANDLIRVFEKEADMELDWYREQFINSTNIIEYEVGDLVDYGNSSAVVLRRLGSMPMPVDVQVEYSDGSTSWHTIPLVIMRGAKTNDGGMKVKVEPDWPWVNSEYELKLDVPLAQIKTVRIDPTLRLADFNLDNNIQGAGRVKSP